MALHLSVHLVVTCGHRRAAVHVPACVCTHTLSLMDRGLVLDESHQLPCGRIRGQAPGPARPPPPSLRPPALCLRSPLGPSRTQAPPSPPTQRHWEAVCMRPGAFSGQGCGPLLSSWTSPQRGQPWPHSQDAGAACVWVLAKCLGCRVSRAGKGSSRPLRRGNLS